MMILCVIVYASYNYIYIDKLNFFAPYILIQIAGNKYHMIVFNQVNFHYTIGHFHFICTFSFQYSIGYMSISDARDASVSYALLYNDHGVIVEANIASIQTSMDFLAKQRRQDGLVVDLVKFSTNTSYPISSFTYLIFR